MTILSKWLNCCSWPIYGSLTGTTNPGQSQHESNGLKGVLHIPQSSKTGASLSNAVSYPGYSLKVSYPSAEVQSAYFTNPANQATNYANNLHTVIWFQVFLSNCNDFWIDTRGLQ